MTTSPASPPQQHTDASSSTKFPASTSEHRAFPEPALLSNQQLNALDTYGNIGYDACMTCGKKLGDDSPKMPCNKCHSVNYCSKQCMQHDLHHIKYICELLQFRRNKQKEHRDVEQELNSIFHRRLVVGDEKDVLLHTGREREIDDFFHKRCVDHVHMQHLLSYPLTVALVACKNAQLVLDRHMKRNRNHIENKNAFVIHVVGAGRTESQHYHVWRELHHALMIEYPQMFKQTIVYLIGPDVHTMHEAQKVRTQKFFGNTLEITCIKSKYHQIYEKRTRNVPTPDLVVMCQPELNSPDYKWNTTLMKLVELGRPILLTASNLPTAMGDVKKLLRKKFGPCRVMIAPTENPYASPWVGQSAEVANDVYRSNSFYSVVLPPDRKSSK